MNKPVDGQSSPESERYTLDQFIDDHIRKGFKIMVDCYSRQLK